MKRCQSPTTFKFLDNIQIFISKRRGWCAKSDERLKIEDDRAEKRDLQNYRPDTESFSSQINLFPNFGTPEKLVPPISSQIHKSRLLITFPLFYRFHIFHVEEVSVYNKFINLIRRDSQLTLPALRFWESLILKQHWSFLGTLASLKQELMFTPQMTGSAKQSENEIR